MATNKLFTPSTGAGVSISATTTSASATVSAAQRDVRIVNAGTAAVFVRFGTGTATATTSDMYMPAGAIEVFDKGTNDKVAAITASGTATVYIVTGEGQ